MNEFDFDSEIKSARQPTNSRRRRELVDNDTIDSVLPSSQKPQVAPRRGSKDDESSSLKSILNDEPNSSSSRTRRGGQLNDLASSKSLGDDEEENEEEEHNSKNDLRGSKKVNQRELNTKAEEELEIPEIPDMDMDAPETNDDLSQKVADAPDIQVHQIATYKELDKEFFKEKAFQFLEGNIDVSLLHCGLSTQQQVTEEEDSIWEWNKLFTEVVSILTNASNKNQTTTIADTKLISEIDLVKGKSVLGGDAIQTSRRERDNVLRNDLAY